MAVASNAQEVVLTDGNEKSIESKIFDVYKNGKRKSFVGILNMLSRVMISSFT